MSENERLAVIETDVKYIREAIDKWPEVCIHHRKALEKDMDIVKSRLRLIAYIFVGLFFLFLGLFGHETGAIKALITMCSAA